MAAQSEALNSLEMQADEALFGGAVDGLVCLFFRNERPLHGLAGVLDWRLHGMISRCLREGAIEGAEGECVYLPVLRHGRVFHLILAGAGNSDMPGARAKPPAETLEKIRKNLASLKIPKVGVSRQDFGGASDTFFAQQLKSPNVWVVS
jgi:hypothetical protein